MVRENSLWAFAVVAIFLVVVLPGLNFAANDNTTVLSVTNETIAVNYSSPVAVDPANEALGFEPNATVYNDSGVELTNETDYLWHPNNGTVEWFDTAQTTDGEDATITYEHTARTQETRDIDGVLSPLGAALALLFLLAAVGAVFRYGAGW